MVNKAECVSRKRTRFSPKDLTWELSKSKAKASNRPLVAGCRMGHKPSLLHVRWWDMAQTNESKYWSTPPPVCVSSVVSNKGKTWPNKNLNQWYNISAVFKSSAFDTRHHISKIPNTNLAPEHATISRNQLLSDLTRAWLVHTVIYSLQILVVSCVCVYFDFYLRIKLNKKDSLKSEWLIPMIKWFESCFWRRSDVSARLVCTR